MKFFKYFMLALTIGVVGIIFGSCTSGVDQSDPRSVAEKAVESYLNGDYVQLKSLVNPDDAYRLEQMDKLIQMADMHKAEHPDYKPEPVSFTFKNIYDGFTGGDFSDASTAAKVTFDTDKGGMITVVLTKVDGKWYYERNR